MFDLYLTLRETINTTIPENRSFTTFRVLNALAMNEETAAIEGTIDETKETPQIEMDYPSLLDRVKAIIIDTIIIAILFIAVANVLQSFEQLYTPTKGIFLFIIFGLYDPLMVSFAHGTLGHKMMGLRVMSASNYEKPVILPLALFRFLVKGLLGWVSFLGILGSSRNRALHDGIGNSIVLYAPKKKGKSKDL